jgi:hypothetical protein
MWSLHYLEVEMVKRSESEEISDAEATRLYTWLTNTAGTQLQEIAGGTLDAPVHSRLSVETLREIERVAGLLADRNADAEEVEDPSLTPFDQLPEKAQKAVKEAEKQGEESPYDTPSEQHLSQVERQDQISGQVTPEPPVPPKASDAKAEAQQPKGNK